MFSSSPMWEGQTERKGWAINLNLPRWVIISIPLWTILRPRRRGPRIHHFIPAINGRATRRCICWQIFKGYQVVGEWYAWGHCATDKEFGLLGKTEPYVICKTCCMMGWRRWKKWRECFYREDGNAIFDNDSGFPATLSSDLYVDLDTGEPLTKSWVDTLAGMYVTNSRGFHGCINWRIDRFGISDWVLFLHFQSIWCGVWKLLMVQHLELQ